MQYGGFERTCDVKVEPNIQPPTQFAIQTPENSTDNSTEDRPEVGTKHRRATKPSTCVRERDLAKLIRGQLSGEKSDMQQFSGVDCWGALA
ncbi:hypothetical protein BHYA_0062g00330 [Botrytis hyacinthi]|uniref:Uncharacterized protein n=1 Tax=Botrytis hyacinthi TaxID=278943 RepID=A0A4Z1GV36_9HELO|nr:hypothetical protein BHYA_0062g00330 [Botrytis hyacinthi]